RVPSMGAVFGAREREARPDGQRKRDDGWQAGIAAGLPALRAGGSALVRQGVALVASSPCALDQVAGRRAAGGGRSVLDPACPRHLDAADRVAAVGRRYPFPAPPGRAPHGLGLRSLGSAARALPAPVIASTRSLPMPDDGMAPMPRN